MTAKLKASITTWTRLEPRVRGDDLSPSLEARVHDPAWLLARQWQLGEFVGEDAGTPVHVRLAVRPEPIVAYRTGGTDAAFDPGIPLDALVGAEPRAASTLAERAEAGTELLDLLAETGCSTAGAASLVGLAVLPSPAGAPISSEGEPLLALAAGRLPDGDALAPVLEAIAAEDKVPDAFGLSTSDEDAVIEAARRWLEWRAALVQAAPNSSWVDERIEHHFELGVAPTDKPAYALVASAWDGERLDWYDLELDPARTAPTRPVGAPAPSDFGEVIPADGIVKREGLPTPLTYPGMPASRWWQFEDARVNFAQIAAQPEDLARMLLVEFASVFGNDWYLWPLVLPLGAVHRITAFEVENTFGDVIEVKAAGARSDADEAWQLFRPTMHGPDGATTAEGLVLLPTLASSLGGEVLEDVVFLRDEVANLAWAIEKTVRGTDGLPFDRHTAASASGDLHATGQTGVPAATDPLRWRFATDVPVHWFPLTPDITGAKRFRRQVLRRVDANGTVRDIRPAGAILAAEPLWIRQEEVPREGARVVRRYQMARGENGRLHVWMARRSEVGRGEGSSGLRYDDAIPPSAKEQP